RPPGLVDRTGRGSRRGGRARPTRGLGAVSGLYLLDTSALSRGHVSAVSARLEPLLDAGQVATCAVMDLEALRQARTTSAVEAVQLARAGMRWAPPTGQGGATGL